MILQLEHVTKAFGGRTLKVEVTQVADNVSKSDAPAMYKELV